MNNSEWLVKRSIEIIRDNQSQTGAFVASPTFQQYHYSWLRDGSFIGYAMLVAGQAQSTERFLRWTSTAINGIKPNWGELERAQKEGGEPAKVAHLPTRFALDGTPVGDQWPNFQIDGYGSWLWLLKQWMEHQQVGQIPAWARAAVETTVRYLRLTWNMPNYDAWEEFGDKIHPATLGCVHAGLVAASTLGLETDDLEHQVRALALSRPTVDGAVPKYLGSEDVDASLLWLAVPFGTLALDDPLMTQTVRRIETELTKDNGVIRYVGDSYYGGGRWIILSAWLGWYHARRGNRQRSRELIQWIESTAREDGSLPEQVTDMANFPEKVQEWIDRWGPVATPLLWSHAMYLLLWIELHQDWSPGSGEITITTVTKGGES